MALVSKQTHLNFKLQQTNRKESACLLCISIIGSSNTTGATSVPTNTPVTTHCMLNNYYDINNNVCMMYQHRIFQQSNNNFRYLLITISIIYLPLSMRSSNNYGLLRKCLTQHEKQNI